MHGVPTPYIEWFKDDKPIDFETVEKLSQEKAYSAKSTNTTPDQVEGIFGISKFKENNAGTV